MHVTLLACFPSIYISIVDVASSDLYKKNADSTPQGMVKRSCIETGINYYAKNALAYVANVNSIYACLAACKNNDQCNGASWDRS